jgi:hypothetical protein
LAPWRVYPIEVLAMRKTCRLVAVLSMVVGVGGARGAEAKEPTQLPPSLRPWVAWVSESDEGRSAACPAHVGDSDPVCAWPSRLDLKVHSRGGSFSQEWHIFRSGLITVPGSKEHWPSQIRLDGRLVPVADHNDDPQIVVPTGRHVITGELRWDTLPESLQVPKETGLVSLVVQGKPIDFPVRQDDGHVFFGRLADVAEEDKVDLSVFRKLTDGSPMVLTTRLVLAVSGKSRELALGKALPGNFAPVAVDSALPVRFDGEGHLRIQARRGTWTIDVRAQASQADSTIARPAPDGLWKEGAEVWVFEARPDLRTVNLEGAPTIDPAQTLLPAEWKLLPAYLMAPLAKLVLVEKQRGNAEPAPERLSLSRTLWLDADGGGFTVKDEVSGEFTRSSRLEMQDETRLGRATVGQVDQFVTRLGGAGKAGIEVRERSARIETTSRIEPRSADISAVGFDHAFDKVEATLNVPAGWELYAATGADRVAGSWIERWALGQMFLLMVLVLLVGYLFGLRTGVVALLAFGLTLVDRAPDVLWLFVLAAEVLARVLREKTLQAARIVRVVAWAVLAVTSVPFVVEQVRFAAHPASSATPSPSRFVNLMARSPDEGQVQQFAAYALKAPQEREHALGQWGGAGVDSGNFGTAGLGRSHSREGLYGLKNVSQGGMGRSQERTISGYARHVAPPPPPKVEEYDPSVVVQTGPGLPRWSWKQATLAFDGPVPREQRVRLFLAPPWFNRSLAVAKVVLLAVLVWLLLHRPLRFRREWWPPKPLVAGLVSLVLLCPAASSAAEYPPTELLETLATRLLEKPECAPECASVGDMVLDVAPKRLHIRLEASALAPSAIALPGDLGAWSPASVRLDGKPASTLARGKGGQLWLALAPGLHSIELAGPLPSRDNIQLILPTHPHHASSRSRGFLVSGIHEDGVVDESVLLSREAVTQAREDDDSVAASTLPPFLRVKRTLVLGLKWEAHTEVTRESPAGTPIVAEIPLLPGESVTTSGIRTEKSRGTVSVDLGPTDSKVSWDSTLAERPEIRLRADPATASRWAESWRVEVGALWHATFTGIPPVRPEAAATMRIPEWAPRPGEEVRVLIDKPKGVEGQTLTIDASNLTVAAGRHSTESSLTIELRSSRGTEHKITLPADAEIATVRRDGMVEPTRQQGRDLVLSVPPGQHTYQVTWRQPSSDLLHFTVPAVELGAASTNSTVAFGIGDAPRWILWLGGPGTGPMVGLWPLTLVLVLAAVLLSRRGSTPLRTRHWLVLGLGLTQVEPLSALLIPACLLALGWRARSVGPGRPALYNAGQAVIVVLFAGAAAAWGSVIDNGLSRVPDMFVVGPASGQVWYQDRAASLLAQPWALSLPMWSYRGLVLVWALGSVVFCLRCARWAWSSFTNHGLWLHDVPPIAVPPSEE